ncbi:peptidoglycan recognition protein family protein [Bifidobacterium vansinderenii]|uniref:N-acetylmuramoyl-L-alanine amidase n=1 Tax=Bifidobacterium vansinderenii TaxID=1984871 RepID=A0A229VZS4_9BIFI|nr:N-acetylmuramoyl-L-alanine amidase [Bifidobacterium vansinderenii]OXN01124.1 N-acetylmuramoyl-L-alanine amidase [Bifidobacterium vansinderenii]
MSVIKERIVNGGHGVFTPSYFCVHSTANPGATAANHASLWSRDYPYAVHLVSDWKEALHTVPYNRVCWQVGNGNRMVEGLEICEATNRDDFARGIIIAAAVVRERLNAHGWGMDRLINHDIARSRWGGTDHTDPIPYFTRWGYTWDQFRNLVATGKEPETMTPQDVWNAGIGQEGEYGKNDIEAWKHLSFTHWDTARLFAILGRTDDAGTGDGTNGDIYTRVVNIDKRVREMSATITAQAAAIEALSKAMGADPQDIAKTVQDAVKAKLDALKITVSAEG